jgi:hypothetical protein
MKSITNFVSSDVKMSLRRTLQLLQRARKQMRSAMIGLVALVLVGCGKPAATKPNPSLATEQYCGFIYQHIITLTIVDTIDPALSFSDKDREGAEWLLDQQWKESGLKDRFFRSCVGRMTTEQVECALETVHVRDINTCVKLIGRK